MSKVKALRCDNCGKIKPEDHLSGVSRQENLFEMLSSYPDIGNSDKADVHYCVECWRTSVYVPSQNMCDRKKDEAGYKAKIKEYGYMLRKQCVHNFTNKRNWDD